MKMKNILGLDLGSSSIGWVLREDNNIIKKGVVTFDSGMKLGTGGYASPYRIRWLVHFHHRKRTG